MILYYVRHAQSGNNALFDATQNDRERVMDPELTELGVRQAARVAEALSCGRSLIQASSPESNGFGVTHLYCSLMVRAVHTGQPIARALGLPLVGWTDLHEGGGIYLEDVDTGRLTGYPGSSHTILTERFPELVWPTGTSRDGWWDRPFEEPAERAGRARRVLAELLRRHGGTEDRVVLVSHGGFFYWFMNAVLDMAVRRNLGFHIYNTSISCLEFSPKFSPEGGLEVHYLNRVDHLVPEMVS